MKKIILLLVLLIFIAGCTGPRTIKNEIPANNVQENPISQQVNTTPPPVVINESMPLIKKEEQTKPTNSTSLINKPIPLTEKEEQTKICTPLLTDTSPRNLKIFDAHVHMTQDYDSNFVISEMDKAGVSMALLYPNGKDTDLTSLDYMAQHPGRFSTFVAFTNPNDQHLVDYTKTQLNTGKFTGIGEINLRYYSGQSYSPPPTVYIPPDTSLILQLVDLSATYHVPLSFHFVPDDPVANAALERMFSHNKDATFIWCHLGFNNMPLNVDTLNDYLLRYPNLYFDTAGIQNMMSDPDQLNSNWRGVFINQTNGYLNAEWKQFFETWNTRIINYRSGARAIFRREKALRICQRFRQVHRRI